MATDPRKMQLRSGECMSIEAYFQLDATGLNTKYEYIDGYAYAMSGDTAFHAWLAMNMVRLLDEQLRSGPCRVFNSDMRVQLSEKRYVFPDVSVSCDGADSLGSNEMVSSPRLIVEILSPTTELYDRGKKFIYYQECATIQEYMMVNTHHQMIEIFRRKGKIWTYQLYRPRQIVEIESLDMQLPFDAIYERSKVPIEDDSKS